MPMTIPCGGCLGCRLERSRQWAIRCIHEASLHAQNSFITLTYNDEHLPENNSLYKPHFQKWMKRLRKRYAHKTIRYYMCGEYGPKLGRPHFHVCLFGFDFDDKKRWKKTPHGDILYRSKKLEDLWTDPKTGKSMGYSSIGEVTFKSAAYVARYIMDKKTGEQALTHYNQIDPDTGEILSERRPEYTDMSRRPGIGKSWFEKYHTDVYPRDELYLRDGRILKPPKYYDTQFELMSPKEFELLKAKRKRASKHNAHNNTRDRLDVREEIQTIKASRLKRETI